MKLFNDRSLVISVLIGLTFLIAGGMFVLSQWAYSESGHGLLLIGYVILSVMLMLALRLKHMTLIVTIMLVMMSALLYSHLKFEWREGYVTSMKSETFFPLDPYIDEYPIFENYIFGGVFGKPNYVDFSEECFENIIAGRVVPRQCQSISLIESHYRLNPKTLINDHYQTMKRTAQSIQRGRIETKEQFESCFNSKKCAVIPLLPAGVDPNQIDQQSLDYIETRKMFWSLINDRNISPEICEFMDLCRAMRDVGVVAIEKPLAL